MERVIEMKKILFELSHPKHFHQFKNLVKTLENRFEIKIVARDKDVLLSLLKEEGYPYEIFGFHGKTLMKKFTLIPNIFWTYFKILKLYKPDIIVSRSSPYAAILSKFLRIKTLVLPDSEVVTFNNYFVIPVSNYVLTPTYYELKHGHNHYFVRGFFENSYLHPSYFQPDLDVLDELGVTPDQPFCILRFVGWFANHDKGKSGFSDSQKCELVSLLLKNYKVFISSEGPLPSEIEKYRLSIQAKSLHSILHYASLYIGDSQSMATEAALLGTPAIRYNSFVGPNDMANFKKLEKLGLLINAHSYENILSTLENGTINSVSKSSSQRISREYFETVGDINVETAELIVKLVV